LCAGKKQKLQLNSDIIRRLPEFITRIAMTFDEISGGAPNFCSDVVLCTLSDKFEHK
jgi:hypothetical protein